MSNKIKLIVEMYNSYCDSYGNIYTMARVTNTRTGKSTEWFGCCGENAVSLCKKIGYEWDNIHYYKTWNNYREWNRTEQKHLTEEQKIKTIKSLNRISKKG